VKRGVFITFDVECSMGGAWANPSFKPVPPSRAVWGENGDKKLGLPLIVEILEQYGLAATFFVEAFIDEQGHPGQSEAICQYLLDHGQDVQLHIHPNHKHYGMKQRGLAFRQTDQMADLEPESQRAMLSEGAERIERWTGRRPVAFRAGNMAASEETLDQLSALGIRIDSSYTFAYADRGSRFNPERPYNGSKWYDGVLELALSGFRQVPLPGLKPSKPLNLNGVSFEECRDAIRLIHGAGADAVVILHSFSLLKKRDVQYDGIRPDWIVTRRFRRLCQWLAATPEIPTYTCTQLAGAIADQSYQACDVPPCRLTHPRGVVRKAVQAWNNLYWT
jgi:peptidoglycan/xylan/chitin deacetylase (PgdA/CDA1 family)